jgi:hypothetical protein
VVFLALNGLTVESQLAATNHSAKGDLEHHLTGNGSTEWSGIATPRTHRIRHRDASPPVGLDVKHAVLQCLAVEAHGPLAHSVSATATTSPNAMPGSQPNRAHIQCRRPPFHLNRSDTVANQLNPMCGVFSEFGISSSS